MKINFVKGEKEGFRKAIIEVNLDAKPSLSKSGKSHILYSTHGFLSLKDKIEDEGVSINMIIIKK